MKTKKSIYLETMLTILFIILKLTEVIDWSWFWVMSPLIFASVVSILYLMVAIVTYVKNVKRNK